MKQSILILTVLGILASSCTKEQLLPANEDASSEKILTHNISSRTYSIGNLTKSTTQVKWFPDDEVAVVSYDDEGIVTFMSNGTLSNISKDSTLADVTVDIDLAAGHYFAFFPASSNQNEVGKELNKSPKEPTLNDAPRLHDLPQTGEATDEIIAFNAVYSCFRLYNIRSTKLPIKVKVYEGSSLLHESVITSRDSDLAAHFTRYGRLLGSDVELIKYYDYCWVIPDGKTYDIKVDVTYTSLIRSRSHSWSGLVGEGGKIYQYDLYLDWVDN